MIWEAPLTEGLLHQPVSDLGLAHSLGSLFLTREAHKQAFAHDTDGKRLFSIHFFLSQHTLLPSLPFPYISGTTHLQVPPYWAESEDLFYRASSGHSSLCTAASWGEKCPFLITQAPLLAPSLPRRDTFLAPRYWGLLSERLLWWLLHAVPGEGACDMNVTSLHSQGKER